MRKRKGKEENAFFSSFLGLSLLLSSSSSLSFCLLLVCVLVFLLGLGKVLRRLQHRLRWDGRAADQEAHRELVRDPLTDLCKKKRSIRVKKKKKKKGRVLIWGVLNFLSSYSLYLDPLLSLPLALVLFLILSFASILSLSLSLTAEDRRNIRSLLFLQFGATSQRAVASRATSRRKSFALVHSSESHQSAKEKEKVKKTRFLLFSLCLPIPPSESADTVQARWCDPHRVASERWEMHEALSHRSAPHPNAKQYQ